jgi:hypothetical protein
MSNKKIKVCTIVRNELIDHYSVNTSYKIQGGGMINVKSVFNRQRQYKDALYPAVLNKVKQEI